MPLADVSSTPIERLSPRVADSHKGDFGRVAIIGGSRGMAGSVALAGMAALRSGAGLVTLVVPRSIQATVASFEPSYMTIGVGEDSAEAIHLQSAAEMIRYCEAVDAVALGPGMGRDPSTDRFVHELYHRVDRPLIVDADGLNALAQHPDTLARPAGPRILTPHPGEFKRLSGEEAGKESSDRAARAAELAGRDTSGRTIVVLKGSGTVVTDGAQFAANETGNPGMATGGTGDSLTGILVALVAQGMSPWEAARLGVYLHGLAGDLAAESLGEVSMIASDVVAHLPEAFLRLASD